MNLIRKYYLGFLSGLFNRFQSLFGPQFDKFFINLKYFLIFGKIINWKKPITYTEKLNVYKISPLSIKWWIYVDKFEVRKWVEKKIGKKYLVPIIGVYRNPDEIDFNSLPKKFVIKTNHGSGWIILCKDKNRLDWPSAQKKLNYWLKTNYYRLHKELSYRLVKPKIIIEKFLGNQNGDIIYDYKFFCFNGKVKLIQVDLDRFTHHSQNFYSPAWKKIPISRIFPVFIKKTKKPKNLKLMLQIASILAKNFPHARVDLYNVNGKIYFGEITFTSYGGFSAFKPEKYNQLLGSFFKL